jgi:hypothetical protein
MIKEKINKNQSHDQSNKNSESQYQNLFIEKNQYYIEKRKLDIQKFLQADILSKEATQ